MIFLVTVRLLEEVDDKVEQTKSKLDGSMKRMKEFIAANSDMRQVIL